MSLYADMREFLENSAPRVRRGWEATDAVPTLYRGITFRSALESAWARTLDHYGIAWEYEPETVALESGKRYVPDFRLEDLSTWIEVKGPHMLRADKVREFARAEGTGTIVLLGFYALRRYLGPALMPDSMQWNDALGYDSRFARCPDCQAWQWLRPQLTRACRRCGETCTGLLAMAGEMQFIPAQDDPFTSLGYGGALYAMVPRGRWLPQPP
jgi:hypothetical protein